MGSGKHFYTTDPHEATVAIQTGRVLEGIACFVLPVTSDPQPPEVGVIRLYKGSIDDHFYTSSQSEADQAVEQFGYTIELVAFDGVPVAVGQKPTFRTTSYYRQQMALVTEHEKPHYQQ